MLQSSFTFSVHQTLPQACTTLTYLNKNRKAIVDKDKVSEGNCSTTDKKILKVVLAILIRSMGNQTQFPFNIWEETHYQIREFFYTSQDSSLLSEEIAAIKGVFYQVSSRSFILLDEIVKKDISSTTEKDFKILHEVLGAFAIEKLYYEKTQRQLQLLEIRNRARDAILQSGFYILYYNEFKEIICCDPEELEKASPQEITFIIRTSLYTKLFLNNAISEIDLKTRLEECCTKVLNSQEDSPLLLNKLYSIYNTILNYLNFEDRKISSCYLRFLRIINDDNSLLQSEHFLGSFSTLPLLIRTLKNYELFIRNIQSDPPSSTNANNTGKTITIHNLDTLIKNGFQAAYERDQFRSAVKELTETYLKQFASKATYYSTLYYSLKERINAQVNRKNYFHYQRYPKMCQDDGYRVLPTPEEFSAFAIAPPLEKLSIEQIIEDYQTKTGIFEKKAPIQSTDSTRHEIETPFQELSLPQPHVMQSSPSPEELNTQEKHLTSSEEEILASELKAVAITTKKKEKEIPHTKKLIQFLQNGHPSLDYQYSQNVFRWFDPSFDPFTTDAKYSKTHYSEIAKKFIQLEHNYGLATDWLVPYFGYKSKGISDTGTKMYQYTMVGEIEAHGQRRFGLFTYAQAIKTGEIFHRFHTKKQQSEAIEEWVEGVLKYSCSTISKGSLAEKIKNIHDTLSKKGVALDGSYIKPLTDYSTLIIHDGKNNAEIRIYAI